MSRPADGRDTDESDSAWWSDSGSGSASPGPARRLDVAPARGRKRRPLRPRAAAARAPDRPSTASWSHPTVRAWAGRAEAWVQEVYRTLWHEAQARQVVHTLHEVHPYVALQDYLHQHRIDATQPLTAIVEAMPPDRFPRCWRAKLAQQLRVYVERIHQYHWDDIQREEAIQPGLLARFQARLTFPTLWTNRLFKTMRGPAAYELRTQLDLLCIHEEHSSRPQAPTRRELRRRAPEDWLRRVRVPSPAGRPKPRARLDPPARSTLVIHAHARDELKGAAPSDPGGRTEAQTLADARHALRAVLRAAVDRYQERVGDQALAPWRRRGQELAHQAQAYARATRDMRVPSAEPETFMDPIVEQFEGDMRAVVQDQGLTQLSTWCREQAQLLHDTVEAHRRQVESLGADDQRLFRSWSGLELQRACCVDAERLLRLWQDAVAQAHATRRRHWPTVPAPGSPLTIRWAEEATRLRRRTEELEARLREVRPALERRLEQLRVAAAMADVGLGLQRRLEAMAQKMERWRHDLQHTGADLDDDEDQDPTGVHWRTKLQPLLALTAPRLRTWWQYEQKAEQRLSARAAQAAAADHGVMYASLFRDLRQDLDRWVARGLTVPPSQQAGLRRADPAAPPTACPTPWAPQLQRAVAPEYHRAWTRRLQHWAQRVRELQDQGQNADGWSVELQALRQDAEVAAARPLEWYWERVSLWTGALVWLLSHGPAPPHVAS